MDLEMLVEAILNITFASRVFVCPLLMTQIWRKNLGNDADLIFIILSRLSYWPNYFHEPLLCDVVLSILRGDSLKEPWFIIGIRMNCNCNEYLEVVFNISVGRIPPRSPFVGKAILHAAERT